MPSPYNPICTIPTSQGNAKKIPHQQKKSMGFVFNIASKEVLTNEGHANAINWFSSCATE
jgi:hypothetical protein